MGRCWLPLLRQPLLPGGPLIARGRHIPGKRRQGVGRRSSWTIELSARWHFPRAVHRNSQDLSRPLTGSPNQRPSASGRSSRPVALVARRASVTRAVRRMVLGVRASAPSSPREGCCPLSVKAMPAPAAETLTSGSGPSSSAAARQGPGSTRRNRSLGVMVMVMGHDPTPRGWIQIRFDEETLGSTPSFGGGDWAAEFACCPPLPAAAAAARPQSREK